MLPTIHKKVFISKHVIFDKHLLPYVQPAQSSPNTSTHLDTFLEFFSTMQDNSSTNGGSTTREILSKTLSIDIADSHHDETDYVLSDSIHDPEDISYGESDNHAADPENQDEPESQDATEVQEPNHISVPNAQGVNLEGDMFGWFNEEINQNPESRIYKQDYRTTTFSHYRRASHDDYIEGKKCVNPSHSFSGNC